MVCPKLNDGNCDKLQLVCPQNYDLKMIKHERCSVFKGKGGLLKKVGKLTRAMGKTKSAKRSKAVKHKKVAKKSSKKRR